jgi:menaquinone-dependent protoporphyrinogen IX oxidase
MSRVLILYGTTDGHTRTIADVLAATFRDGGCRVEVVDGGDTDTSRDFEYTDWDALRAFARNFARAHELAYWPPAAAPEVRV